MAADRNLKHTGMAGCIILTLLTLLLFCGALVCGQVDLPFSTVIETLFGKDNDAVAHAIIFEARLPMAITAVCAGASLSVAGLILQTVFRNPLAGPSLLGVSSGASLGVALVMMGGASGVLLADASVGSWLIVMCAAIAGAMIVIAILLSFSSVVRNGVMLLIIGVMVSYLTSSIISLLSYIAPSESLKTFTLWGLGSYSGITMSKIPAFAFATLILCLLSIGCIKPLNAFLLGERYASSLGYNVKRTRGVLLLLSGLLTAVVTAYCGPIGFIGLIVPHLVRMTFRSSNHAIILPASLLMGAAVSLLCVILANGTLSDNALPINVVTPLIGVPIICYIILQRNRLPYFK